MRNRLASVLPVAVFVAGVAATLFVWTALRGVEARRAAAIAESEARRAADELLAALDGYRESLAGIAARTGAVLQENRGWQIELKGMRAALWADPAGRVVWVTPAEGTSLLPGADLSLNEADRTALLQVRRTGRPVFTATAARPGGGEGFRLIVPVREGERFSGFLVGDFDAREMCAAVLLGRGSPDWAVAVFLTGHEVYRTRSPTEGRWLAQAALSPPAQGWTIRTAPTREGLGRIDSAVPTFVLGTGPVLALLFAVAVALGQSAARRAAEAESAHAALRRSEERYRRLVDTSPYAIGVHMDGRIVFANAAAARLFRASEAADLVGLPILDRIHPDDREAARERISRMLAGEVDLYPAEDRYLRLDGSEVAVEVTAAPFEHEGRPAVQVIALDLSAHKHAERSRAESEARYRDLFLAHPQPMWVYDLATLGFLAVNEAAIQKYGYSREELLGMTIREIRPPEDLPRLEASVAASRTRPGYEESRGWRHRAKDGRIFEVEISSHQLDYGGHAARLIVAQDISERRRLEAQLRHAQKIEAVGTLAGGIAHDFNNLLQALLSSTQAAAQRVSDPVVERALAEIQAHVQRGAALTRQLLLFSRQAPSRREPIDVAALVEEHATMLRRLLPETIVLAVAIGQRPLPVEADAGQLGQVLTNLVVNARDAMPGGGRLSVRAGVEGSEIVLEVADGGTGMPPEVKERIFDPFFTTKPQGKGTGLGLAVVWGIVQEHGGRIEVDSEPGRGTTFRVAFPAGVRLATPPPAAEAAAALPLGHGERVLVVEDEEGPRQALTDLLGVLGYSVRAVAGGAEASALPAAPAFDLVLADYLMPGATGIQVAAELGARWPGIRIIVMSGYAPDDLARDLLAGGTVYFLQKPFDMATLAQALRAALDTP